MSLLNRANGFSGIGTFVSSNEDELDSINYNIIEYSTPSLSMGQIELRKDGMVGSVPGDLNPETSVQLRFIVDEKLEVFFSLYERQIEQSKNQKLDLFTIKVMDNKHKFFAQMNYYKSFITNISPLIYSTINEETVIFLDVTMSYLYFKPEKIS